MRWVNLLGSGVLKAREGVAASYQISLILVNELTGHAQVNQDASRSALQSEDEQLPHPINGGELVALQSGQKLVSGAFYRFG